MAKLTGTSAPSAENVRTVEVFLTALQDEDYETADAALDDNLVYQNVGLPTIHGRNKTITLWRKMAGRIGFEIKIHRIVADGDAVLCERADAVIVGPLRVQFWVCGVFEVHNGRITLWRDYFDFFDLFKATVRGLAALAIPSLKATF
ncbi:limonene-1,2-epoxide hydrolase [Mycobacterium haemophilum]|uniref:Limonene-1,2-epoxide hydrolase n=1 Tax=Mycobacterium haemophilum TaxID=29311 RepID=A0A0I9U491_9MYCO|nr:limonene-1,2-epoxide hydrolase family protein [Mycobacterium haemophilum]KLO29486.1 limonene-1,2-epoxide hydrolase [Mycobacterium haemophilum]KLO35938.1 limonene-1,2-epoxide hydrolase [Mycobacterium haemophilum]KLO41496.1 limonene-1,2-epoxide hydrolase [Mycobacterium haemophilum]KLO49376.1 limonene-1,2-epoxide hydrolase [Mycobacterium haemophilum]